MSRYTFTPGSRNDGHMFQFLDSAGNVHRYEPDDFTAHSERVALFTSERHVPMAVVDNRVRMLQVLPESES